MPAARHRLLPKQLQLGEGAVERLLRGVCAALMLGSGHLHCPLILARLQEALKILALAQYWMRGL